MTEKRGKTRGAETARVVNSAMTTAGSLGWEQAFGSRGSIPSLQSQSAGVRIEYSEAKSEAAQLRAHLQALQEYRRGLQRLHITQQSLTLAHEREILSLRSTATDVYAQAAELARTAETAARTIVASRGKHRIEEALYRQLKEEQVAGWEGGKRGWKRRLEKLEAKLAAADNRAKEREEEFMGVLEQRLREKSEIEAELHRLREERVTDQRQMLLLHRQSLLVRPARPTPRRRRSNDTRQQSARDLLKTLRTSLSNGALMQVPGK